MSIFLLGFFSFLVIGVPIAIVLGLSALLYLLVTGQSQFLMVFPQRMFFGLDQFVLLAVPLFILAGNLMNVGGLSDRIIRFCQVLLGRFRGGLSLVTVMASMVFSGVSGSATADASAIGTVVIPGMAREGYPRNYSAALVGMASVIGPIIPPSIQMIIYAVLSGTSVATLFVAGIVPGVLLGLGLMAYALWVAHRRGYPREAPASLSEIAAATWHAVPVLLLPFLIIGSILGGVLTPTEAAVVAVVYALLVGGLFYRTLTWRSIEQAFFSTAIVTAGLMVIVAMASMVSFIFGIAQIPDQVVRAMLGLTENKYLLLMLVNVALLLLGCLLDPIAAMIITTPVLLELGKLLALDPIHLGMIVVLNLVIGLATPPVGLCLFIVCSIGRVPIESVSRAIWPMLCVSLAVLALVTYVPQVVLFLPDLLMR